MGEIVDRHSDWASSDKVSEKPWWSYKRQRHDWKFAATVVVQHASLCCNSWCHDITSWKASHYHSSHYSACGVRRGKAIALLARPEQMYRLVWFTWSIWWQCTAASFSIQRVGSKCDETENVVSEIQKSFDSVSVRNVTIKEMSDGAQPEWVEAGIKVDKATVQIDPSILFLRCRALSTTRQWWQHSLLCSWDDGSCSYFSLQRLLLEESRQVWTWQRNQEEHEEYYVRLCNSI